jgi:prophage antirepressor-like protein
MIEEIKTDNNCIVKAFENNPISILHEDIDNKKIYYFKASDIGKVLGIVNIHSTIQNYEEDDERVIRKAYDTEKRIQDTTFLSSQGVYRLLYNSKKEIAKKFRKWAGNILDDIIFNESGELKRQLEEKENLLKEQIKLIKRLENKPETEGFYKSNGYIYLIKDNSNIGHYKIGLSENPSERVKNLNCGSSTNSLELVKTFETKNVVLSERLIHSALFPHKIKKQKEWFYVSNEQLVIYFIKTIEKCIEFIDKYSFNNISEELESINKNEIVLQKQIVQVEKCVQTDIIIKDIDLLHDTANDKDTIIFNRFINDSCIIDDLEYISMRELVYQYKTWSKINSIFNYKDFEQYIESKFIVKRMFNKMFNTDMRCVLGINLNKSFYEFEFKEPFTDFENFLKSNCIKVPTGKLNRSTLKNSYEKWCNSNNKKNPTKSDINSLCKFLDKYFFKDYFFEGTSSYHGWYGITIQENVLKGTGITSTLCKKISICKVHKDNPNEIVQEWGSQKEASRDLGLKPGTLKYRLDNKSIFNEVYYLKRKSDILNA